jgi:transposase
MFLKPSFNKKTGRTYLSMVYSYRDKEKRYSRTKTVEKFGYLDELQKVYDDPIAHFTAVVEERNNAAKEETAEYAITANKNEVLPGNSANRMNYGYIAILKILYSLGIDRFLVNKKQSTKIECDTSAVMKLLVISRILSPGSKLKAFGERERYFDFDKKVNFTLVDIYRCLPYFAELSTGIQLLIHERITKIYGRKTDLIYYDVTNYYFEIDEEDKLRAKGPSKEHRPDPIVQMGLATDADGIPISYEVFPGNESEKLHLRPMILELRKNYADGKVIAVADAAQNSGNNIYYLDQGKQGYVFSQSIRGGSAEFKGYVVGEKGYEWFGDEYKRKSRIVRREIQVDFVKGGKKVKRKVLVDQRQIVFYSEKYAKRAKAKREAAIKKAHKIINNPAEFTRATSYGALKYVKNIEVDAKTGEIKESKAKPCFNMEQLIEDEKYDGYYAIVTNVFDEGKDKGKFGDDKIIGIYRGLWRIEDSFRVTKHELEARPIYLSRHDRIHGHFLICYIALVIMRLIQKETGHRHSTAKLIDAMNNISCSNETENLYLFNYRSEVTDDLGQALGVDFTKKRLTRGEIKKNLGSVKKI